MHAIILIKVRSMVEMKVMEWNGSIIIIIASVCKKNIYGLVARNSLTN